MVHPCDTWVTPPLPVHFSENQCQTPTGPHGLPLLRRRGRIMSYEMAAKRRSCIKLIFILVLHFDSVFTTCMERDNQIQGYLISTEPPYDNYYNISKAVYPSVDLPSLMIEITVTFLTTADNSTSTLSGSFPTNVVISNGSTSTNNSKQNGSDSRRTAANSVKTYMWSMSCLYVSGGNISLSSMNIFSLGAIWPNRRARKLYITVPQFCSGSPSDPHQENTMLYFLSTVWWGLYFILHFIIYNSLYFIFYFAVCLLSI